MLKKILYTVVAALLLVSCDVINENERFIPVDVKVGERRVLLEEFTGFRCVNCPTAAEIAHELVDLYGEHVVVMSLHPKGTAWTKPAEGYIDLTSDIATVYFQYFGSPETFPIGMIDRTPFDGSVLQDRSAWMTCVNQQLVVDPTLTMSLTATIDTTTRTVNLKTTITRQEDFSGNVSLQLLLLESDIIGFQMMPNGSQNLEYVHNHILREAINGNWGENVSLPSVGSEVEMINQYVVPDTYVLGNCSVVAFLYYEDTKEVIQAYEVEL